MLYYQYEFNFLIHILWRDKMGYGKITAKQQEILEYIKEEILKRGYPPAVREICEAVNLKSTSSVHSHLETLEKNGYILLEDYSLQTSACDIPNFIREPFAISLSKGCKEFIEKTSSRKLFITTKFEELVSNDFKTYEDIQLEEAQNQTKIAHESLEEARKQTKAAIDSLVEAQEQTLKSQDSLVEAQKQTFWSRMNTSSRFRTEKRRTCTDTCSTMITCPRLRSTTDTCR